MDPMLFSLPELILDDGEEPNLVSPRYQRPFPVDRSAPQEELETLRLPEPSLQTSQERSHLVTNELASKRPSRVAETPQKRANSDQRTDNLSLTLKDSNQQSVQHLVPSLSCPIEQIPAQDSPCPLSLQALPPGAMSQPELMPLLPAELIGAPCCLSPITSTPNSTFGLSPCVLVPISSPVVMCCPYLPPGSLVLLPEIHPSCSCPQSVRPVHQPYAPDLVSRRAAQQVSEQFRSESMSSGKERTEEQVKSEEKQQKNTPRRNKLQVNTNGKRTKPKVSPASLLCLDEETLAERAFEEYMMIMDSLTLKIPESVEAKENEDDTKQETENCSFLEHLEEMCSDEDFVRKVGSTLNIEYLESLLSADPEPIDLLALEKQDQGVMQLEHQPPTGASINPLTVEKSLVASTPNSKKLDSLLSSDPKPIDLLPLRELQQEPLETLLLQHLHPPSADNHSIIPITEETSPATLYEQSPIQRAKLPILGPHGAQSDTNPNHNGQNAHLSMRNIGSGEGWTSCAPRLSLPYLEEAVSPLDRNHSPFTDYSSSSTLELLANIYSDTSLTSDLEARNNNRLVTESAATYPTEDASEQASKFLSKLADTQSAQTPEKLQGGPSPRNPPASNAPATSGAEGSYENPQAFAVKDPAPSIRADLLTISPRQLASSPALIVPASSTAQISEPEEQCCPKNRYPQPSPLRGAKNKVQLRRSQRLSGQNETDKARLCGELIMESAKETNIKNTAKLIPERDGVTYEKQKRCSSGGRQLSKQEESHFKESSQATKTANTAEQFYMTGQMEQHLNGRTENGVEMNPDAQELSKGRVKRNEEGIQTSSFERRTRTMTTEDNVQLTPLPATRAMGKIKHSEMERGEIKSAPKREMQRGNKQENATEELLVSGQVSNEDKVFRDQSPVSPPESSLQSPRVQTCAHSLKDSADDQCRQKSCEGRLTKTIYEKNAPLSLVLCPETQQQCKKNASSRDGVTRTETLVFYNLRSRTHEPNVSNRTEVQENEATHHPSNEDKVSRGTTPLVSQPQTLSTKDFLKDDQSRQESTEGLLHERQKSPVKCGEKNPQLSPALCPETQQQRKMVASSRDGVTRTETWKFYSLRSRTLEPDVSNGTVNRTGVQESKATEATHRPSTENKVSEDSNHFGVRQSSPHSSRIQENKATHEQSNPKPSPDQTTGVKDDNEVEHPSLTSSPMKRCRHEYREASEERETRVDEDKMISFSPMKQERWKKKLTWNEKDEDETQKEVETPGCRLSPPLTRSNRKARRPVIETRARVRIRTNIPCSRKFPSKCQDLTLYKTNGHKQLLDNKKEGRKRAKKHQEGGKR